MTWIDTLVVTAVIAVGMIIMYRALKEPMDLLFGLIGKGLAAIRDKIQGMGGGDDYVETIRYG